MKIALIGYGKMGHMIEEIALSRDHEIVCTIDVNNPEAIDSPAFKSADVAIEFTNPKVAYANYLKSFKHNVKVVSGSTGWREEHEEDIRRMCTEEGQTLFWSSNFSLGVTVFRAVNRSLAKIMNQFPEYDVNVEEVHHIHKLDSPSGTAITLANELMAEIDRKTLWAQGIYSSPEGVKENKIAKGDVLRVDSYRRDEVTGIHTVKYNCDADEITITHDAHNRKGFALGAVLAAEYTVKHVGLLTMEDLFKF